MPERLVVICDVGLNMAVKDEVAGKTHFEIAKETVEAIIEQKILFSGKADRVAIFLLGTTKTKNHLAEEDTYRHIREKMELQQVSLELFERVRDLEMQQAQGDVLDALIIAIDYLKKMATPAKTNRYRVALVTNAGGPLVPESDIDAIVEQFDDQRFSLDVYGVGFGDISKVASLKESIKREEGQPAIKDESQRTMLQRRGELFLREFADRVKGEVHGAGETEANLVQARAVRTTKLKSTLELGPWLCLPLRISSRTANSADLTLKNMSTLAKDDGSVSMGTVLAFEDPESGGPESSDGARAAPEETQPGYLYGKSVVTIDEALLEVAGRKEEGPSVKVLGFIPSESVDIASIVGSTSVVMADEEAGEEVLVAFGALVKAVKQKEQFLLCRHVARARSDPRLVALAPAEKSGNRLLFYLYPLPYDEDVRGFDFAPLPTSSKAPASMFPSAATRRQQFPTTAQLSAAERLITSLDLTSEAAKQHGNNLKPARLFRPATQRILQTVHERIRNPKAGVPPLDRTVAGAYAPFKPLFSSAKKGIEEYEKVFPTRVRQAAKKRRFWQEAVEKQESGVGETEGATVAAENEIEHIGTDTIGDFTAMVTSGKPDRIREAYTSLQGFVDLYALNGVYHDQAITCCKAMRKHSINLNQPELYNRWLQDVSERYPTRGPTFQSLWKRLGEEHVGLVHSGECASSQYSADQSQDIFEIEQSKEKEPESQPEELEDLLI